MNKDATSLPGKTDWSALQKSTEEDIDFSDTPELTEEELAAMEPTRKVIPGFGPTARASYSEEAILARIAIGTGAVAGKPLIRDTNIPVEHLVRLLAQGTSRAEIVEIYPQLETEDISAALLYTASLLAKTEKLLLPTP